MKNKFIKYVTVAIGVVIFLTIWEIALEPLVLNWHDHPGKQWRMASIGMVVSVLLLIPPFIVTRRSTRARERAEASLQDMVENLEQTVRERTHAYEKLNAQLTDEMAQHSASAALLSDVTDNIHEVFWVSSPDDDKILYVSPAYGDIWGTGPGQIPSHSNAFLRASAGDATPEHPGSSANRSRNVDRNYQITRPDGDTRWIRDRSYPVTDATGTITRVVGIAEDITQLKALQKNLLHAQRLEAVGTLAGGIAHDFNNLLATILVSAGTLRVKTAQDDGRLKNVSDITYACRQGAALVKNLIRFAHQEETILMPVAVGNLVLETVSMVRATFDRRVTIHDDVQADLWDVQGDPTQVHQLLMNLLVNARDAILSQGTGTLTVTCRNRQLDALSPLLAKGGTPGRHVEIVVADNGPGIPTATQGKVFDPFYSTKEPGQGTGLGLSTVHGIVTAHGGSVHLESAPGAGCRFCVYIPATSATPKENDPPDLPPITTSLATGAILVVEDEAPLRSTIVDHLSERGHRVASAANGKQALATVATDIDDLDVVILDLMIPLVSGCEVLRVLRRDHPGLSIIIMSGYADSDVQNEAKALGFDALLTKPFELATLDGEIARVLSERGRS